MSPAEWQADTEPIDKLGYLEVTYTVSEMLAKEYVLLL